MEKVFHSFFNKQTFDIIPITVPLVMKYSERHLRRNPQLREVKLYLTVACFVFIEFPHPA